MKRSLILILPVALLGGCASNNGAADSSLLTRVAQAIVGGKAYDRAVVAARDGNDAAFLRAQRDLERAGGEFSAPGANSLAAQAVTLAIDFGQKAQAARGAEAQNYRQKEAEQYRRALQLGAARSDDPQLLNAVGYFLAERGDGADEFKQAEQMTRKSLALWKQLMDNATLDTTRAAYQFSMANVRDSVAWALYRQKRFDEAAREQELAIKEAREAAVKAGILGQSWSKMSPELPYHLGEIYRAQGKTAQARAQWQEALKLDPNFQDAISALQKPQSNTPDLSVPDAPSDRMDL